MQKEIVWESHGYLLEFLLSTFIMCFIRTLSPFKAGFRFKKYRVRNSTTSLQKK